MQRISPFVRTFVRATFTGAVGLTCIGLVGCRRPQGDTPKIKGDSAVVGGVAPPTPYPRARWRFAAPQALEHTVLWASHILVRYEGASPAAPFVPSSWVPDAPAPAHTRAEALTLANAIARRAAEHPDEFAALARETSEDVVTRAAGGSLGGVTASDLLLAPQALDALAALQPGEVSRVVATKYGLHVFRRGAPPPEAGVALRRVVVPYDASSAPGSTRAPLGRSRADALALARTIAEEARADSGALDGSITKFPAPSGFDASGDLGLWSTRDAGILPREREALAALPVGGIVGPMDSPEGVEVLMRTPGDPRPTYAVEVLQIPYDAAAERGALSRREASALAHSSLDALQGDPSRMAELQRLHCCTEVQLWSRGRRPSALVDYAAGLTPGGTGHDVLDAQTDFLVVRRADAAHATPPPLAFDLPLPAKPDVFATAAQSSGTRVQKYVRDLGTEAPKTLGLDAAKSARVASLHEELARAFVPDETRATREYAVTVFQDALRRELSKDQYDRYQELASAKVASALMNMF